MLRLPGPKGSRPSHFDIRFYPSRSQFQRLSQNSAPIGTSSSRAGQRHDDVGLILEPKCFNSKGFNNLVRAVGIGFADQNNNWSGLQSKRGVSPSCCWLCLLPCQRMLRSAGLAISLTILASIALSRCFLDSLCFIPHSYILHDAIQSYLAHRSFALEKSIIHSASLGQLLSSCLVRLPLFRGPMRLTRSGTQPPGVLCFVHDGNERHALETSVQK
jgi:hypothetical protein